ncbi:hypothetical protein AVEN_43005-1 [Araneus ventricosus]|uniref:Uncharacterized protein n=1 Tax=Araneus ventricosus TaxID=182803 RepID=A0A4Y2WE48_ARAVE|nr:hypothetical protein AVEN_43005-1 [Araneus ventricosus]
MIVTQVRPSDAYRISQLEPRNGRPYATIVHVSQLKAWRSWNEEDDDSITNSHNEPEMQRPNELYENHCVMEILCRTDRTFFNVIFHLILSFMNVYLFCFCNDIIECKQNVVQLRSIEKSGWSNVSVFNIMPDKSTTAT